MSDVLYFNGRFTTTDEKVIGVEDRGFQFADGVYEVAKFLDRNILFFDAHFDRLERSLAAMEIPQPLDRAALVAVFSELISRSELNEGIVYLQITRGDSPRTHFYPEDCRPTVVAYPRPFTFPTSEKKEKGVRVITVNDDRWHRCDIKSINLLANAMAKKKAQRSGCEEALFVADGWIREGASSNFFIVQGDRLITHPTGPNVLAGTVRDQVIGLALANRIRVDERPIHENELPAIDEAFTTNTTGGVMAVSEIDSRIIGNGRRGQMTLQMQQLFDALEMSSTRRA
jgi:D-alanine transaminase